MRLNYQKSIYETEENTMANASSKTSILRFRRRKCIANLYKLQIKMKFETNWFKKVNHKYYYKKVKWKKKQIKLKNPKSKAK